MSGEATVNKQTQSDVVKVGLLLAVEKIMSWRHDIVWPRPFTRYQWSVYRFTWAEECVSKGTGCSQKEFLFLSHMKCAQKTKAHELQSVVMDLRSTLLVIGGSACSFKLLNTTVRFLPTPQTARTKTWKWRNISTSLAHSSLTGAWAVLWCVNTQ